MMVRTKYVFRAGGDENYLAAIERLAGEVGWSLDFAPVDAEKLGQCSAPVRASRVDCTRAAFIARLCRAAGIAEGVRPVPKAGKR